MLGDRRSPLAGCWSSTELELRPGEENVANPQTSVSVPINGWRWSPREKVAARRAFDLALDRDLQATIRETKERAELIRQASDLWEVEAWLAEQRRRIDRTFDFRYSVLPFVFATLLRDRLLSEEDLRGLDQEKVDTIRHILQT
jgi:hypothetical protein